MFCEDVFQAILLLKDLTITSKYTNMQSTKIFPSSFAMGIVSTIGCILSAVGLILTMIIFLTIRYVL